MPATNESERDKVATFNEEHYRERREWREEQGLPPLEDVPGLDRTTLSRIRRGLRTPGVDKGLLLARELGTQVEQLWQVAA